MPKKIVILNGSPRRNGNTSALVKAFTNGAESVGHTVTEFFLNNMNIHGCKGCFGGHITPELEHRKSGYVERKRRPYQGNVVRIA